MNRMKTLGKCFWIGIVIAMVMSLVACKLEPETSTPKEIFHTTLPRYEEREPQLWLATLIGAKHEESGETDVWNFQENVKWADNKTVRALTEKTKEAVILAKLSFVEDYAQSGDLGVTLPGTAEKMKVMPGDLVLSNGNQILLCYKEHEGEYVRLGKLDNFAESEWFARLFRDKWDIVLAFYYCK
ncbi:MAG: hypothetical protein IKG93_13325 [Clostridiales bacterium]|nr:hypothetical protein [Clostridiales bacterium]